MKHLLLVTAMVVIGPAAGRASGPAYPSAEELTKQAQIIKPSVAELKWERIPWLTDLAQAQRIAREERRPILLWVTGDDPLERC